MEHRVRSLNEAPVREGRRYVLYWMTSARRVRCSFALEHAVERARALSCSLLVFEPLRVGYPFASDRLHTFILQGMAVNHARLSGTAVGSYPYVETAPGEGKGLLEALAQDAALVVGDDWPCFFIPAMQAAAAKRLDVRFEVVDGNGLYPMFATPRVFTTAHSFRTHLQKELPRHLRRFPLEDPLAGARLKPFEGVAAEIERRWPRASAALLSASPAAVARLPVDHSVPAVPTVGGSEAGEARLSLFVKRKLRDYHEARNEPELDGTSALSPYLHFGHVSAHQVFSAMAAAEGWSPALLGAPNGGAKEGYWGLSAAAEAFVDELVTWRELAFNMASHRPDDFTRFESLPGWAQDTLERHQADPRPRLYTREQLDAAATHDPLWNAAHMQLKTDGWFHNYLRMLWGKKILEWSRTPREALATMEHLMGRYSLDGRDPVSWSGYLWVMGRYDRAWGPERPIFGTVRYMSSENTARKVSVKRYIEKYAPVTGDLFRR